MRKSFTRLFKVFMLLCMMSLQVVAQGATFGISLSPRDGSCAASRTGDYVIDFNRTVYPNGLGVFALSNQFGTEYLTVQVPQTIPAGQNEFFSANGNMSVLFNADKVFIKLHDYTLSAETPYYITVSEDAIKDGSGTFFDGLEDHNAAALTPCINNVPDWDFTTIAAGPLDVKADANGFMFNPRDNALNVNRNHGADGSANVYTVTFNRPVYWKATGGQGSALTAYPNGWLKDGYFALYTSTDGFNEEYGGNVVAHILSSVSITGNVLSFTFSDYPNPGTPELLDPNTEYYLRIRPDIIVDYYYVNENLKTIDHMWDGVNTNTEWNWKTKDGKAAVVAKAGWFDSSCTPDTASFWIVIDDDKTAMTTQSLKIGTSGTTVTESTIKPFITINGSPIDAGSNVYFSVVADNYLVGGSSDGGANLLIRVKPKNLTYTTNTDYTVGLTSGMLDAGGDAILGKTFKLTSKDYTAPVSSTVTANADGTTFDILGRLDEPGTIYYIVVKRDDVTKDGNFDWWQPTANELYNAIGDPTYSATRGTSSTSDDKANIQIFASGSIDVLTKFPDRTWHERITGLPESHGTYYNVYYVAFDKVCSGHNAISAATPHVNNNATGVIKIQEATLDILPPVVSTWSADLLDPNTDKSPAPDAADGCSDDNDNDIEGIKRMGAIYVKMNEAVELAAGYGNAITTGSQVEGIFLVEDNGVAVGLNAAQCSYDPATFTFKLVPDSAFKSSATVRVTLLANKIQDKADDAEFGPNGTEKLTPEYSEFCVENYVGPRAVCFDDDIDYWWTPTDGQTMVPNDATILLAWDQQLYAPAEDESAPGVITAISNTPGSPTFVGRYIRIRSAATAGAAPTGAVVYQFDPNDPDANLDVFNFHFANNDEGAQITIELVNGNLFESETWYYVEIESGLQTVERISLDWDDADMVTEPNYSSCAPYNYHMVFQSRDNISPTCLFYEDNDFDPTADLGLLEGTDIAVGSYILARISEWVQLGFDGFRDLSYTDTIIDANALRPYFTLKDPDGNPIQFDCKYFSLDRSTDEATVYIDPYNYPDAGDETPNWVACEEGLEVCFLGIEPAYEDDILEDDASNPVGAECDLFNIYCEPGEIPCLEFITLNGINVPSVPGKTGKDFLRNIGDFTRVDLLTLDFGFGGAMDTIPGQILELWSSTGLVATIASEDGRDIGAASDIIRYRFNLTGNPGWIDNEDYFVRISGPSMTSTSSVWTCDYPDPAIQAGVDTAVFFHTIDGTPPVITGFIPDDPSYGGCLLDKDVTDIIINWNEPIAKGAGSMELRRVTPTGNTWVASINIASGTLSHGDSTLT
ncbi:MAG TPA: hypothetical protein PLK12_11860, partial [Prolixibacteraceae bacterium]|nr:hypothetical protein [Prolixibacteraceae bacterium]